MNDKFVPLALPGKAAADAGNGTFRLKVLPTAEGQNSPANTPAPAAAPAVAAAGSPAAASANNGNHSEVKLERDAQQRIARIRLQCSCGQAHELDCSYE